MLTKSSQSIHQLIAAAAAAASAAAAATAAATAVVVGQSYRLHSPPPTTIRLQSYWSLSCDYRQDHGLWLHSNATRVGSGVRISRGGTFESIGKHEK